MAAWHAGDWAGLFVLAAILGFAGSLVAAARHLGRTRSTDEARSSWKSSYLGLALVVLALAAVLPAAALFADVFDQEVETLTRLRALKLVDALAERGRRINQIYAPVLTAEMLQRRVAEGLDRPLPPQWPLSLASQHGEECIDDDLAALMNRHWTASVIQFLPVYNEESLELREMPYRSASDCRWWSRRDQLSQQLRFDHPVVNPATFEGSRDGLMDAAAVLPLRGPGPTTGRFTLVLIASLVTSVAAWWVVRALADNLFGLSFDEDEPPPVEGVEKGIGRFFLRPEEDTVVKLRVEARVIDVRMAKKPDELSKFVPEDPAERVLVLHLEHRLDEPTWNRAKLTLLETLSSKHEGGFDVVSEIDPLGYFLRRLRSVGDRANEENYITMEETSRWATVLARLSKVRSYLSASGQGGETGLDPLLAEECRWTRRLKGIEQEIRETEGWRRLNREELICCVGDLAEAHYRTLWSACTDEDRLVLIHLAKEGFVNPRSWQTVGRLMRRRLVRRTPAIRPMNESFRRFVLGAESETMISAWEGAAGVSSWRRLRTGLMIVLMAGGGFLFATQPDFVGKYVSFLPALVGAVGALMQLFDRQAATRSNGSTAP